MAKTTLSRFTTQQEKPIIERKTPIRHKKNGERTVVGYLCASNRKQAYLSPRTKESHLYGKHNSDPESYAISQEIIDSVLVDNDVMAVFIPETDTGFMYEYEVSQFESGYKHSFQIDFEDDEQMAVPVEFARRWSSTEVDLRL